MIVGLNVCVVTGFACCLIIILAVFLLLRPPLTPPLLLLRPREIRNLSVLDREFFAALCAFAIALLTFACALLRCD